MFSDALTFERTNTLRLGTCALAEAIWPPFNKKRKENINTLLGGRVTWSGETLYTLTPVCSRL